FACAFFFQAEDGIRDFHVTGVQTCALPICGAVFRHADLRGANLAGAKLEATDLRYANLRYAKVGEVDLSKALVTPEQLKGLCFNSSTVFADGTRPTQLASQCGGGSATTDSMSCRLRRDPLPARCDR